MPSDKHLRCSFCGKSKDSVKRFISGPSVYICNECISLCNEILAEEEIKEATSAATPVPTPTEIKEVLDQYVVGQEMAKRSLAASCLATHLHPVHSTDDRKHVEAFEVLHRS